MMEAAFAPVLAAVEAGAIPGAALGVVTADGRSWTRIAGWAAIEPEREALTADHWFDLASLTKPIATTTMILTLAEQGRLDLDAPLTDAVPDLRQYDMAAPERRLTFRQCLAHATHLPAVAPIYTYGDDPARLRAFILQREWRSGPAVYSDINYMLLGIAIERLMGEDAQGTDGAQRRWKGGEGAAVGEWSLGEGLAFAPRGPAVATERCTWRGRVLKGEVHDENAAALGGQAGHAGLFGTVAGVLGFAQGLLDGSTSAFVLDAIRMRVRDHRTCGWERRFSGWHGGDACSDETIGHTGFTGTGLWVDLARGLAWCLLTNRVHPTRHGANAIFALRPTVGEAVIAAFG